MNSSAPPLDLLVDGLVGHFTEVSSLNFELDSIQVTSESVLRGRVDHLGFYFRIIRGPSVEHQLARYSLVIVKIADGKSGFRLREISEKIVVAGAVRGLFNDDLSHVIAQAVNDVLQIYLVVPNTHHIIRTREESIRRGTRHAQQNRTDDE